MDVRPHAICLDKTPQAPQHYECTAGPFHAAPHHAATGGDERNACHFLTVHEVAELLQVPVSWIYGRLRKRSTQRLPGYRLGKYWRFREDEILTWIECHREGSYAA
jgi:excisionase family DNA binding protein